MAVSSRAWKIVKNKMRPTDHVLSVIGERTTIARRSKRQQCTMWCRDDKPQKNDRHLLLVIRRIRPVITDTKLARLIACYIFKGDFVATYEAAQCDKRFILFLNTTYATSNHSIAQEIVL